MEPYRIVLTDDHALFRDGLKSLIASFPDVAVVGEADDGLKLLDLLKKVAADLVILDISMPNLRGMEATKQIKTLYPKTRVLILTMHKSVEYLDSALSCGANGYLLKQNAYGDLYSAIKTIREGRVYISALLAEEVNDVLVQRCRGIGVACEALTLREREVLKLVAEGKSSKEIAGLLYISIMTVHNHRANIKKKLKTKTNAELVKFAIEQGFI